MASNLMASDLLDIDWGERARNILANARQSGTRPGRVPEIRVPVRAEPVEVREKNVVTDPDSWLNRGLNRLAGDAASIILGEPSGNDVVDMGVANVPLAGAGAILAAGGMPGIVDVIPGAGELKNIAKIPKYTLEFVTKHFGERGLRNLDNALTKYPKAAKPSVNDAVYIMRTGLGGEQVPAIEAYRAQNALGDVSVLFDDKSPQEIIKDARERYEIVKTSPIERARKLADKGYRLFNRGIDNNDFYDILNGSNIISSLKDYMSKSPAELNHLLDMIEDGAYTKLKVGNILQGQRAMGLNNDRLHSTLRLMNELETSPLQDWEKIAAAQERKDARDAEKAIKKAARQQPVKPVPKKEAQKEARAIEVAPNPAPATVVDVPEVSSVEPVKVGGPNKWRENGWKSSQYSPNFYERFGSRLDEDSKRDLFVLDSLKNHWVRQLGDPENRGFSAAEILNGLERADARHNKTNYNQISREFRKDIERNIASGNMPGTSIAFKQQFKNNTPVEGRTTPTLMLRMDEKPKVFMDPRIWADEAEGPDVYELLFRPAVDRKLNSLNPRYWVY